MTHGGRSVDLSRERARGELTQRRLPNAINLALARPTVFLPCLTMDDPTVSSEPAVDLGATIWSFPEFIAVSRSDPSERASSPSGTPAHTLTDHLF